jgi:micrococcal nuclease
MYTYRAKVLRIIDGDTIECDIDLGFYIRFKSIVRLDGIDTPEKNSKVQDKRIKAIAATEYTRTHLENKEIIVKTRLDKTDKYGRILGLIYESDSELSLNNSFNLKLIQENLAIPYTGGKKNV